MTARTTALAGLAAVALSVTPIAASEASAADAVPTAVVAAAVPTAGLAVPDAVGTVPTVGGPVEAAAFWTILCDMFGGNCA